jgi:hypothetical protein
MGTRRPLRGLEAPSGRMTMGMAIERARLVRAVVIGLQPCPARVDQERQERVRDAAFAQVGYEPD